MDPGTDRILVELLRGTYSKSQEGSNRWYNVITSLLVSHRISGLPRITPPSDCVITTHY